MKRSPGGCRPPGPKISQEVRDFAARLNGESRMKRMRDKFRDLVSGSISALRKQTGYAQVRKKQP